MAKPQKLVIDTAERKYLLDGKDISSHLTEIKVKMRGYEKIVKLRYDRPDIVLTGILVTNELEATPTICDCGYEIAPYRFKLDCLCPKCGKHIRVTDGQIFCN